MSFHLVAIILTIVQTKQIIIYISETIQKHRTNNTKHNKYKYTHYQNTHTHTHTHTHTLQNPHITKPTHTHTHT